MINLIHQSMQLKLKSDQEKNWINKTFGSWTILEILVGGNGRKCRVKCKCGNIRDIELKTIRNGKSTQCRSCASKLINLRHGHARYKDHEKTSEYSIYHCMKSRCYTPTNKNFNHYGGRGIIICDRWLSNFLNFFEDMGKRPSKKHSIDRIDVNGNYTPENCRWSLQKEQTQNKRKVGKLQSEVDSLKKELQKYKDKLEVS